MIITKKKLQQIIDEEFSRAIVRRQKKLNEDVEKLAPFPPASLMKTIVDALKTVGLSVASKETTPGARKVWLNVSKPARTHDEFDDDDGFEDFADEHSAPVETTDVDIPKCFKALKSVGLGVSTSKDRHETVLRGRGFEIVIPMSHERMNIGADVFVKVFAGKYAEEERQGIDTTDFEHRNY